MFSSFPFLHESIFSVYQRNVVVFEIIQSRHMEAREEEYPAVYNHAGALKGNQ